MSGGSFDYAYFDAGQLADTLRDMAAEMDKADYPDKVPTRLIDLAAHLEDEQELLRAVEWVFDGDKGPDSLENV